MTKTSKSRCRPVCYSEKLAAEICARMAGGESLRKICARDGMPVTTTVYRWLLKHEQFRQSYVWARKLQADHLAEEILEIADNAANGDGNRDALNIAKLRIDARKWLAGQLRPKKYGDENDFEQSADSTDTAPALNVIIESNSKT